MQLDLSALSRVSPAEYAVRFAFGAAIAVAAGLVSLQFGSVPGGLLLAFPALLPAALTLIEKKEGTDRAVEDTHGAVSGALGLIAFAACAHVLLERTAAVAALGVATAAWITVAYGAYGLAALLRGLSGEEQYLPPIPLSDVTPLIVALERAGLRVAVAESCSGGLLGALLTGVPGAGRVLAGGTIAYTEAVKIDDLGVPAVLLRTRGAVSAEVAQAMAAGARRRFGADVGIGVTGLTGSPAEGKPPGLTYVAVVGPGGLGRIAELPDQRGPMADREEAVRAALRMGVEVADTVARGGPRVTTTLTGEDAAQPV